MEYYKLDSTTLPLPDDFDIEEYKLTKANRVASGLMVMELIALKSKFSIKYNLLTGEEMQILIDILFTPRIYYEFEYLGNGDVVKTFTVYGGALKRTKAIANTGDWVYTDVTISLIEQ